MVWWSWLLFGLFLLILAVQAFGSFYLMFFGVGALLVGLLTGLGLVSTPWLEWVLFTGLSVALLALVRARVLRSLGTTASSKVDSLIGETAIVLDDIASNAVGKAELRGTTWTARNDSAISLRKGARCRVERVEGLTLGIRAE